MANHKSALKQHRQDVKRRGRNRLNRSRMRSAIKRLRAAVTSEDASQAKELLVPTLALIDRTDRLGAIHPNAAARTKSRLTRAVNRIAG